MSITDNRKRNRILMVLFIGVLMGALDIAIVAPALPALQAGFGVGDRILAWTFTIYVLFNLIGTPLMAKLSDRTGRRTIYVLDVALFALGSLVVALSPNFAVLLIGRAMQGLGAGGIFPVASAVIGDTFPPEKRGGALGLIGAVFGLAFLIGPILGGILLGLFGWRSLFLVNLPIALIVIVLALATLPSTRPAERRPFDWIGMTVLGVLLASLAFGINQLDTTNFGCQLALAQRMGAAAADDDPHPGLRGRRAPRRRSGAASVDLGAAPGQTGRCAIGWRGPGRGGHGLHAAIGRRGARIGALAGQLHPDARGAGDGVRLPDGGPIPG